MNATARSAARDGAVLDEGTDGTAAIADLYGEATLGGRGGEAERIALDCLVAGMSVAELYERVIAPAMARIGRLWADGRMTIVDEHLASALNLKVMAAVFGMALAARPAASAGRVLLAGVEGDHHGVGIRMAGDVLELAGFEVLYLGENVPTDQLIRSVAVNRPDLVAIAVPTPAVATAGSDAVAALRAEFAGLPILLGGSGAKAIASGPEVATAVSLAELVERASSLLPTAPEDDDPPPPVRLQDAGWRRREEGEATPEDRFLEIAVEAAEAMREGARSAEAYRRLAHEDPLTGVANRRAFEERVEMTIESARPAVIVMVDLDGFKEVNDRLGHLAGDGVLRTVAKLLRRVAGPDDFVARLGGDEFALLLDSDSVEEGRQMAGRFLAALHPDARAKGVTATCGVSRLDRDRRQALIEADLALYRGKSAGGDRVELPRD